MKRDFANCYVLSGNSKIALFYVHSAVVGSIIVLTSLTELAGKPP